MTTEYEDIKPELGQLTADIVSAYVGNNAIPVEGLPEIISDVHGALSVAASVSNTEPEEVLKPAVQIGRSATADAIKCLYCGKAFKTLKRHLLALHHVTPEQYRAKWGLKPDYPMTAPRYAEVRSAQAKKTGLGQRRKFQ